MWSPLFQQGLSILDGHNPDLVALGQRLAHHAVHHREGHVLWVDGSHGFNPYDFAELNLVRGHEADAGAERVLIKRCMTPFQWDTVLTKHVAAKLTEVRASLVLVLPYDRLFSTDELKDWEQVDYVRYSLKHLSSLAARHGVPILLGADIRRWWLTHPELAQLTFEGAQRRWRLERGADGWPTVAEIEQPFRARMGGQLTLLDFLGDETGDGTGDANDTDSESGPGDGITADGGTMALAGSPRGSLRTS